MSPLPITADLLFYFAVAWALIFLYRASGSKGLIMLFMLWGTLHIVLGAFGFYRATDAIPPRPLFMLLPVTVAMLTMIAIPKGRAWFRQHDLALLTMVHVLRVPIELFLHDAAESGAIPMMMTYSGTNLDIFSGLSAPLIYLYIRRKKKPPRGMLVGWNLLCLGLLLNVVFTAIMSLPSPMQTLNFETPNVLVTQIPYVLLPAVIVPIVIYAHLAALVKLSTSDQWK